MSVDPGAATRKGTVRRRVLTTLAGVARVVTAVFALVLVMYVIFVVGKANPGNWLYGLVADWSHGLTLGLNNLFAPEDPSLRVVVNYGTAAIVWLIVGALLGRVLRRLAR